ncbi:ATP-sulfurylase [Cotonvirus japonicus]|uniref:adenylyl-sulfate kinase n=1 Tax=Cotonvirus japonicus TaxID=2811091 RepID=A0ABM7NSS0_9VIRU|nr:ATP-sulfurylase [Cotonvirus japonicus]BCS83214.1 ATP-sulfurylase [Cotonvirus japonicus]
MDTVINSKLEDICNDYPSLILNDRQLYDYEMIHNNGFNPLTGFMKYDEYISCINNMRLPNGNLWPIPIVLHVSEKWLLENILNKEINNVPENIMEFDNYDKYLSSSYTILKHETGLPLAIMKNESIYKMDLFTEAKNVYNAITDNIIDTNHPYVNILNNYQNQGLIYCLGGQLILSKDVPHYDFVEYRNTPKQVKNKFSSEPGVNIVAFQTRNPLHKSHYMLTKFALEEATRKNGLPSKLLLHPVVGVTQSVDVDYHTRVKCYKQLVKKYEENGAILSLLPLSMRMAGPKEAVWHAIIRKNYGATHFVVGRDHAGPSYDRNNGKKFYGPYDAQNLLMKYADEIGINVITSQMIVFSIEKFQAHKIYSEKYNKPIYNITENDVKNLDFMCELQESDGMFKSIDKINPENEYFFEISGTQQRKLLRENKSIPNWFSYPEIIELLRQEFSKDKGIVFYFIGLSGSGKTTIANTFLSILKENTFKTITYLDGDIIRLNLSKGLGFSQEDRSTNVRRIGYVASEIAKHGGICVVANIAPYVNDRIFNKNLIESTGGRYVEIFVDTDISVCEKRDVKGLYKLARENKIKLTGVNDPFERPINSTIHINGADDISTICENLIKFIHDNHFF